MFTITPIDYAALCDVVDDLRTTMPADSPQRLSLDAASNALMEQDALRFDADDRLVLQSAGHPSILYYIDLDRGRCTCPGFRHHKHCRHVNIGRLVKAMQMPLVLVLDVPSISRELAQEQMDELFAK